MWTMNALEWIQHKPNISKSIEVKQQGSEVSTENVPHSE